jgi:rubredoxin
MGPAHSATYWGARMPHRICPQCERPGRLLEAASQQAWVIYYRCDACGHVWLYDKEDINAPPRDVTLRVAEKTVVGATWPT